MVTVNEHSIVTGSYVEYPTASLRYAYGAVKIVY